MKYMGSKRRLAIKILSEIQSVIESRKYEYWVEPFVGGGNMIEKVNSFQGFSHLKCIGADINESCIKALKYIKNMENEIDFPKNNLEFTEDDYKQSIKEELTEKNCYVGYAFSYAGQWRAGWRRDKQQKRDYVREAYRNAVTQSKLIQNVRFIEESYQTLVIPENSIVYCDPPYLNTAKYKTKEQFNHEQFYGWCLDNKDKYRIFISEYWMPSEFECVKEFNHLNSLNNKKVTEKLYRI